MEDYARNTRNVLHGLGITILIFAILILIIAIFFFVMRKNPKFDKNPVKVIYILAFIIFVLSIILGIVYMSKSNTLDESTGIYNKYISSNCFSDKAINDATGNIIDYSTQVKSRFSSYALYFFLVSLILLIIGLGVAAFRKGTFGKKQLLTKPWNPI